MTTVFNPNNRTDHTKSLAFFDPAGGVTTQRFDVMKYRQFDKLTDSQLGFFWRPEEIDITKDANDFKLLSANEKHIFTANLKRQILLDSVQGRSPNLAFLPVVSLPEIESFITAWAFSETIHSRSYSYIIRNVYANPSRVFDELMDIKEIVDCAEDICTNYDRLIDLSMWYRLLGEGDHVINGQTLSIKMYDLKKALWLAIMSVNILEGIRFFASFSASWAFAELKKMEGNAKIIKLISRDENVHLAATQVLLKILPKDDPDYEKIAAETNAECVELFRSAADQEKTWANYLFKDGSIIGLNEQLLCEYIEWIVNKRMIAVGLQPLFKTGSNPLPWTQRWIAGSDVQVAPQQVAISSYTIGATKQDVTKDTFKGFTL